MGTSPGGQLLDGGEVVVGHLDQGHHVVLAGDQLTEDAGHIGLWHHTFS
jgi:hypothetical protein